MPTCHRGLMFAGISWGEKRRGRQAEVDTHRWPSLTNCVPYPAFLPDAWPPRRLHFPASFAARHVARLPSASESDMNKGNMHNFLVLSSKGEQFRELRKSSVPPPSHPTRLFSGERTYGQSWNGHMGSQYGSHVFKTAEKPGLWWLQQSVQPYTFRKHMSHLCPATKPIC